MATKGKSVKPAQADVQDLGNIGANVAAELQGTILILKLDLSQNIGPSASGKSLNIASTRGNMPVPGTNMKLGVNLYQPQ